MCIYIYGLVRLTSLTKTEQNEILARWSKKLGEIGVPVPARTGFGHVFPLCEFSVSGEVGGGGEIFLKGSRKIFNCLLFALKGLHVFFSRSHFGSKFLKPLGIWRQNMQSGPPAQNKVESDSALFGAGVRTARFGAICPEV